MKGPTEILEKRSAEVLAACASIYDAAYWNANGRPLVFRAEVMEKFDGFANTFFGVDLTTNRSTIKHEILIDPRTILRNSDYFLMVLCHELAHIVARHYTGKSGHGAMFKKYYMQIVNLVGKAGLYKDRQVFINEVKKNIEQYCGKRDISTKRMFCNKCGFICYFKNETKEIRQVLKGTRNHWSRNNEFVCSNAVSVEVVSAIASQED